jgi:hypothetical protein
MNEQTDSDSDSNYGILKTPMTRITMSLLLIQSTLIFMPSHAD